ncbi:hypothetical protein ALC152_04240 [Arcobacter sp. 15-2]|uniref:hypothetical protein n=1 Tax=Arcobacter sp. 15-2 TaxID=3374109 RepID=UPI00399D1BE4
MKKTMSIGILGSIIALCFAGCQPANIQAQMRVASDNSNMKTRCEEVDMRSNTEMQEVFSKYDGWRVFYISEYTTSNKIGTSGSICFEKNN